MHNGEELRYTKAQLLIHNMLFQIIQFSHGKQKKLMVLFNDQISQVHLRHLNLKIGSEMQHSPKLVYNYTLFV